MNKEEVRFAEMLLGLKSKASRGCQWTQEEHHLVEAGIKAEGEVLILTACCILVSGYTSRYKMAPEILQDAIESNNPSAYVEMSIYEAVVSIGPMQCDTYRDSLIAFIERSISKRSVELTNTVCLLGMIARLGELRALSLLKSLKVDSDLQVRENVSFLLRSLSSGPV